MLTHPKTLFKLKRLEASYEPYIFRPLLNLDAFESIETSEHLRQVPSNGWQAVTLPMTWGRVWSNTWFKTTLNINENLVGKTLYVQAQTGAVETMFWQNGVPRGIFSKESEVGARGYHHTLCLDNNFSMGDKLQIAFESYAGHPCVGTHPNDPREAPSKDPASYQHIFEGATIVERDELVKDFVFDLKTLNQLVKHLPEHSFRRGSVIESLNQVFKFVPQCPDECSENSWREGLINARDAMAPELAKTNGSTPGLAGIIGHSHMDTAWLWTTEETIRKCARTFSNALSLMEQYDEYLFIQSSTLHLEQMQDFYPKIFEGIKQRISEGRWEPNGASFVEADGNLPSGESQIRQFTRGIAFLKNEFNYTPDTYWLPDTFGYSASLPQIIRGCGLKYFCTTKLSWNETNVFPHDSFKWQGIDGSEVTAHFNETHCWPDPQTLLSRLQGISEGKYAGSGFSIRHPEITDRRLIAYGFGDGGGGPMYEMLEMGRRIKDLEGVPKTQNMRVGDFMDDLVSQSPNLPLHFGELYLELHRGTLTQQAAIKRGNRKLESALRTAELIDTSARLNGQDGIDPQILKDWWEVLLINQFHDILPGTAIPEVHDKALRLYDKTLSDIESTIEVCRASSGDTLTILNPLSWVNDEVFSIPVNDTCKSAKGLSQMYSNMDGESQLMLGGLSLPALSTKSVYLETNETATSTSPFKIDKKHIDTPFYEAELSPSGGLNKLFYKASKRLLGKGDSPLNQFLIGEDLPALWDNWDIDNDQKNKLNASVTLESQTIESNGELHLRIRSRYSLGQRSHLTQDMIFYAHNQRIDFETRVDWQETHSLLKVKFDLNVFTQHLRSEVGFGFVDRPNHDNTAQDRATFEVSQHKFSDLSESRFGIAILNDCKYGITAYGSEIHLSLIKSGGHPDPRGDYGLHEFSYSLLPHEGDFSTPSVTQPAYALNHKPIAISNTFSSIASIDSDHIIIEAIKWSDDGKGYILRIFEAERTAGQCQLSLAHPGETILETDMCENKGIRLPVKNNKVTLNFRPFEIKTLKVEL